MYHHKQTKTSKHQNVYNNYFIIFLPFISNILYLFISISSIIATSRVSTIGLLLGVSRVPTIWLLLWLLLLLRVSRVPTIGLLLWLLLLLRVIQVSRLLCPQSRVHPTRRGTRGGTSLLSICRSLPLGHPRGDIDIIRPPTAVHSLHKPWREGVRVLLGGLRGARRRRLCCCCCCRALGERPAGLTGGLVEVKFCAPLGIEHQLPPRGQGLLPLLLLGVLPSLLLLRLTLLLEAGGEGLGGHTAVGCVAEAGEGVDGGGAAGCFLLGLLLLLRLLLLGLLGGLLLLLRIEVGWDRKLGEIDGFSAVRECVDVVFPTAELGINGWVL